MSSESIERFDLEHELQLNKKYGQLTIPETWELLARYERIVKELEAQTCTGEHDGTVKECAFCSEIRRWQDGIRDHLIKQFDVPDGRIDGAGCDSGDPLDFTLAEITQGIGYLIDVRPSLSDAIKEVEKMRDEWQEKGSQSTYYDSMKRTANKILECLKSLGPQRED
jgi:hypothetical protein